VEAGSRVFAVSTVTSATLPLHGTTKVGTLTQHAGVGNDSAPGLIHHGRVATAEHSERAVPAALGGSIRAGGGNAFRHLGASTLRY